MGELSHPKSFRDFVVYQKARTLYSDPKNAFFHEQAALFFASDTDTDTHREN